MNITFVVLLAFVSTILCIAVLKPIAGRLNLVDKPSDRKQHAGSVPLVGGIAIWLAFSVCMLFIGLTFETILMILLGGMLVLIGALDDAFDLSAKVRLFLQGAIALLACLFGGAVVTSLGAVILPGAEIQLGMLAIPFTIFAMVGLVNATNMSDGIDGLCGIQMLIPFAGLSILAGISGDYEHLSGLMVLCGCLLGFLVFNLRTPWRNRATVFLGDAGSSFLGFVLAWYLIDMSQGANAVIQPVAVLWFTMLLMYGTIGVVARRIMRGRSPLQPDREHLHHVFLLANFTVSGTIVAMSIFTLVGVVIGMASTLILVPENSLFALYLLVGILFVRWILQTWSKMRFLRRSICRRRGERRVMTSSNWPFAERRIHQRDRRQTVPQHKEMAESNG